MLTSLFFNPIVSFVIFLNPIKSTLLDHCYHFVLKDVCFQCSGVVLPLARFNWSKTRGDLAVCIGISPFLTLCTE